MTLVSQSGQAKRLLTPLLIFVVVCGLAWLGWKSAQQSNSLIRPLLAQANDGSLWETVGENFPVSRASDDQEWVATAYNTQDDQYLVVWQDKRDLITTRLDIYAQRLAADGTPIGDEIIVTRRQLNQDFPDATYNSARNEYLVVWSDQRDARSNGSDIYGQRISTDGERTGSDIPISTEIRPQLYPRVAYNPDADEYLVVWEDSRTLSTTSSDIYGQRVAGDGSRLGSNFAVSNNSEAQNNPDVAYSSASQQYLVAWDDDREGDVTGVDIYAQLVTNVGALEGANFALSTASGDQGNVRIGYNSDSDEFLVIWEDSRAFNITNIDIYGQRVGANGALQGANIALSTNNSAETQPALAFGANLGGYLLVWRDDRNEGGTSDDIFGRALKGAGEQVGADFEIAVAEGRQQQAQTAYNTTTGEFLVVWHDARNSATVRDIYGQRIGPRVEPTATPTNTATATETLTVTPTATATPTGVLTPTLTSTLTSTPTATQPTGPTDTPTITSTPTETPIPPTPTNTPVGYPGPSPTPTPEGFVTSYLPLLQRSHQSCGFGNPDSDEPANNQWESATPYGYGRWEGRTFWDPSAPPGQEGSDIDWYEWVVEWTGTHWIWPENTSSNVEVYAEVFIATGDPLRPLKLLTYGKGRQEVELEMESTYYLKIKNVGTNPPTVGCYDLILDP